MTKTDLRTCSNGHEYEKSSDCPTCPICEEERKPADGLLSRIGAPARRALEGEGITTLAELATYSEAEVLALHGVGPSTMPELRAALDENESSFRNE